MLWSWFHYRNDIRLHYFHSEENDDFKHTQNARRYKCIKSNKYLFKKPPETST